MLIKDAIDVQFRDIKVNMLCVGDKVIWQRYVKVKPSVLWIIDENDIRIVDVESNTEWSVV